MDDGYDDIDLNGFSDEAVLARLRLEFRGFFAAESAKEADAMGALVLAQRAHRGLSGTPLRLMDIPPVFRSEPERASDAIDQLVAAQRDAVRQSQAFQQLDSVERGQIEAKWMSPPRAD